MNNAPGNRYARDDRVIVTDLRTGIRHAGVVIEPPLGGERMVIRYDTGETVRVGRGFVSPWKPHPKSDPGTDALGSLL